MNTPNPIKMTNSASEHKLYSTYVCLINDIKPDFNKKTIKNGSTTSLNDVESKPNINDDSKQDIAAIKVERTKAFHELKDKDIKDDGNVATTSTEYDESELEDNLFVPYDNSHILSLNRMKWLTDGHDGSPDASPQSVTPVLSTSSFCSMDSEDPNHERNIDDRHLSTILRLDREHNLFGLSNIAIIGAKQSKKSRKDNDKPVFPQTAIVQICCSTSCCKHKSNTNLPNSLQCGCARSCFFDPCSSCGPCNYFSCSKSVCGNCCGAGCALCGLDPVCQECNDCRGMKIKIDKKPVYEPSPCELTPRSSCVLTKPLAARTCTHEPRCMPPSGTFPYLMPCFWPARAAAPCSNPAFCFHNPPCPPPRPIRSCPTREKCPPKCNENKKKCTNKLCIGTYMKTISDLPNKLKRNIKSAKSKRNAVCECALPQCTFCFVKKPVSKSEDSTTVRVVVKDSNLQEKVRIDK